MGKKINKQKLPNGIRLKRSKNKKEQLLLNRKWNFAKFAELKINKNHHTDTEFILRILRIEPLITNVYCK